MRSSIAERKIFVDLDGVLADFDGHFEKCFGVRPVQDTYQPSNMWDLIREHGRFYRELPPFPDFLDLWNGVKIYDPSPIVLTGIPFSIPNVKEQKREWVWEHLGPEAQVICCPSRKKFEYGKPGDILIDDRTKYRHFWEDMGGIFVLHTAVIPTLAALAVLCKPAGKPGT